MDSNDGRGDVNRQLEIRVLHLRTMRVHVISANEVQGVTVSATDLVNGLSAYASYYNEIETHYALQKGA